MSALFYYVSVIDGQRRALLAGPYETHEAALAMVRPVKLKAIAADLWADFYAFGTASSRKLLPTKFGAVLA